MVDNKIKELAWEQSRNFTFNERCREFAPLYDVRLSQGVPNIGKAVPPNFKERADTFMHFVQAQKFPEKIDFRFGISFDDSCSAPGIFSYSKRKNTESVLIPDHYAIGEYGGKLQQSANDWIPKSEKLVFYGTDTGDWEDLRNNQRMSFCNRFIGSSDILAKITCLAQNSEEKVASIYPNHKLFRGPHVSIKDQLQHKYILSIDGNASAWDRVPWILNSNSLCFMLNPQYDNWFYPVLRDRFHYVQCSVDDVEKKLMYYRSNPAEVQFMVRNAKQFVKDFLVKTQQEKYFRNLVEFCNEKYHLELRA